MPISAEDLLHGRTPADLPASAPDRDWLQSGDFLREAQLTDVDVAVVALDRVREFSWLGSGTAQRYRPWLVMNSGFSQSDGWYRVVLGLMSSQDFSAVCGSVEFFAGRSDFYDLAPADLSEDSAEEIEAGFPRVGTGFVVGDYFRLD
jgi:hypothetical protein